MRLGEILFYYAKHIKVESKVPFKAVEPLKLKDRVSSKNQKTIERGCMYEVSLLLTCLEENNFEDKNCIPQIKTVNACYEKHGENMRRRNIEQDKVVPVPNSKNFTHKQITYLLRQYPTV